MLEEKIMSDYKEAMKARDSLKSTVLSCLRAEFMNTALAKKKDKLDDNDCIAVIRKQIKSRQDSIEQFTVGCRLELAEKEKKELEILKIYLPVEMPVEEIKKIIEEIIIAIGAQGMKDMGRVMKEINAIIAGKADSKTVSDLVKERLSK
ncbi:MAG: GatB/YqeY domain-containing protein [Candidatus Omnitrophota bacterium]